jgi:uroporphyrinogen-III decarboxylase
MNGRERILGAYRGETIDTVPFAPNIYQWFYYHLVNHSLPPELAEAQHPFDALRHLGADILSRWDTMWCTKTAYTAGTYSEEYIGESDWDRPLVTAFNTYPPHCTERRRQFATPYGTLTQNWAYMPEAGADFETKYWWTDWDEFEAIRYMLEARRYAFDAQEFQQWVERVGDDGVVMLNITESPLKALHWLAGPQNATYFILDHPEEMKALARVHQEQALALLNEVVATPGADIFICLDDMDSMFYPPYFYRDYCQDFFTQAAEVIHQHGKHLMVHACGRSKALLPLVGEARIDALEGVTPRPMGDVQLNTVRAMTGYEHFTLNGGMDPPHQELTEQAEPILHEYVRDLFQSLPDKRHFVFASSCNTSPLTPWQNLCYFRDAAREFGALDA